jgi:tetratricopeptide (TPR) repeat protein
MPTNTDLLQRGIEAARAKRTAEARELLMQCVQLDEQNEQAWLWLSGVVESLDDRRVCLDNVLALNPANQRAQAGLRWLDQHAPLPPPGPVEHCPHCDAPLPASGEKCPACKQPVLIVCAHCGEFTEIRKPQCIHCGHFSGDFKQRTKFYVNLANDYVSEGKLAPAQWAVDQAVASTPHEAQDWAGIAAVRVKLDRPGDAIAAYQQALTRAPGDLQIYVGLHDLYRRGKLDAEAQGVRDQVLRQFQADHDRLIEFGQMLMDRRLPPAEALRFYQRAVELRPQNVATRLQIGALYFDSGDAATAREHFSEAVRLTDGKSTLGQQARQALARAKAARRSGEGAEGGGTDRIRQTAGPLLISITAALANAQLSPLHISPISWAALIGSGVGAYLWQAAGEPGRTRSARTIIGLGVWLISFGLIVIRV